MLGDEINLSLRLVHVLSDEGHVITYNAKKDVRSIWENAPYSLQRDRVYEVCPPQYNKISQKFHAFFQEVA